MRNGFIHDRLLLEPLARYLRSRGAKVYREHLIHMGARIGYGDLWVEIGAKRWLIEAENGPRRVPGDLDKARALNADLLAIIAPTWPVTRAIRRRLKFLGVQRPLGVPEVCVLPIGAAIRWFEIRSPLQHCGDISSGRTGPANP